MVAVFLHVDALAAAGLPRVEERAVDEILDCLRQIGIGAHISRILAAELEPDAGKGAGRGLLDLLPAEHGARDVHLVDLPRRDDRRGRRMGQGQCLHEALRCAGPVEGLLETLADEQGLRRMFENHGVACHQGGHDRVDCGEIGIVPGRDDEHEAERLARHEAAELILGAGFDESERLRDRDHMAGPLLEAAQLACAVADRTAHLPSELGHDLVAHGKHGVDGREAEPGSLGDRRPPPVAPRGAGHRQRRFDLGAAVRLPLRIDASIDRRDATDHLRYSLKLRCPALLTIARSRASIPNR